MSPPSRLGLIINTSNQANYLARTLIAVAEQMSAPDEVLLADDGSTDDTRNLFQRWCAGQTVRTAHVWQPQEGFRRARIRWW